jgi:hypothetical protein
MMFFILRTPELADPYLKWGGGVTRYSPSPMVVEKSIALTIPESAGHFSNCEQRENLRTYHKITPACGRLAHPKRNVKGGGAFDFIHHKCLVCTITDIKPPFGDNVTQLDAKGAVVRAPPRRRPPQTC